MKRWWLVPSIVVCLVGALWFYKASGARELNLLTWDFYLAKDTVSEFERRYGIKVNVTIYASNEDLYANVASKPGVFDVAFPSDYMINRLREGGKLQKIDKEQLPNLQNVDDRYRGNYYDDRDEYNVPFLFGTTGFAVDVRAVAPIEAETISWKTLADPRFRQRVAVIDDKRFVLGSALLELGKNPNTRSEDDLSQAVELLRKARHSIKAFTPDTGKDMLLRQEVDILYAWNGDILQVQSARPEVRYFIPSAGSLRFQDGMVILSGAPHVREAHTLINYLLDAQVSAAITNEVFYGNSNRAAMPLIRAEIVRNTASFPTAEEFRRLRWIQHFPEADALYQKFWEAVKR